MRGCPSNPEFTQFCFSEFYLFILATALKIYKTIILPVVLYGCKTWSLTLREEFRLRVFENWMLRRIFGPQRDENGERRLQNEELHSLYCSPNIVRVIKSRRLRWAGLYTRMEKDRSVSFLILAGRPTEKRPLGSPRIRWGDNIRTGLK